MFGTAVTVYTERHGPWSNVLHALHPVTCAFTACKGDTGVLT